MNYSYYPLQINYDSNMGVAPLWVRYKLPILYKSEAANPQPMNIGLWYDSYTGRILRPANGFREVQGTTIYDQPMEYIDVPITMQTELGVQSEPVVQIIVNSTRK